MYMQNEHISFHYADRMMQMYLQSEHVSFHFADRMLKLIRPEPGIAYVDLVVCFEDDQGQEVEGPPVRYYFGV